MFQDPPISLYLNEHLPRAESGHVPSMIAVAGYYLGTEGAAPDIEQAIFWLEVAARQGSEEALVLLGQIFELGWGVPQDCNKAEDFYTKAQSAGGFKGAYLLGLLYDLSRCKQRDTLRALQFYQVAAKRGHLISALRASQIMRSEYFRWRHRVIGWTDSVMALGKLFLYICTSKQVERIWGPGRLLKDTRLTRKLKKGTRFENDGLLF